MKQTIYSELRYRKVNTESVKTKFHIVEGVFVLWSTRHLDRWKTEQKNMQIIGTVLFVAVFVINNALYGGTFILHHG